MPVINLLNQSAPTKSIDQNSAALINMYLVQDSDNGKYQVAAYPTPGLTVFATISSPVRALFTEHSVTYAVGGNTFYSIASNGIPTTLGTLNTSTGFAKIVGINAELFIIDGTNGYCFIPSLSASTTLGANALNGATTIQLASMSNALPGTTVVVTLNSGSTTTTIQTVNYAASTVTISPGLGGAATSGNGVAITGTNIFSQIYATTFPQTALDITAQDEFGLAIQATSQTWNASAISDLTTWPSLSFAAVTGDQSNLVAVATLHREIYLFQENTFEVWDNLGTANFTFGRNTSVFGQWGCSARSSLAKGNNTLYLLARSITGGHQVVVIQNYTPVVISTPGINYQISTYSTVSDAVGFLYQQEGHEFYVLTFPTAGVTWVYDVSLGVWHQRQSLVSAAQTRWLPSCYTFNYNVSLVGDYQSGNIYKLDMTNFTENGTAITRTIVTHPFYTAGTWTFADKVQVDFDEGAASSSNTLNLYVSRDGGRTFGSAKPNSLAGAGQINGGYRVYWGRLGAAKIFVLKLQTTMNALFVVLGAWVNTRQGSS